MDQTILVIVQFVIKNANVKYVKIIKENYRVCLYLPINKNCFATIVKKSV